MNRNSTRARLFLRRNRGIESQRRRVSDSDFSYSDDCGHGVHLGNNVSPFGRFDGSLSGILYREIQRLRV
jgi:hypothetical protein